MPFHNYRLDLQATLESMLTSKLDVGKQLWEAFITTGELGSSGAISMAKVEELQKADPSLTHETVVAFRAHHALADGVSLTAAMGDLADEAQEIQQAVSTEIKRRRRISRDKLAKLTFWQRLLLKIHQVFNIWIGGIKAFTYHGYLWIVSRPHPFDKIIQTDDNTFGQSTRAVSWCDIAPVDHAKQVAKILCPNSTLNDLIIACVSYAVSKQLQIHSESGEFGKVTLPTHVNVAIPVHLRGGIVPPGESMGNRIGAMVVRVPTGTDPENRVPDIAKVVNWVKSTPMAYLSYLMTQVSAHLLSPKLCQAAFRMSNANATVVVSNVRGPSRPLHWNGRQIVATAGFVPLPPGIPIGVVVQSYNGTITLSVTADRKAVPDADQFMIWIIEEYTRLHHHAVSQQQKENAKSDVAEFC